MNKLEGLSENDLLELIGADIAKSEKNMAVLPLSKEKLVAIGKEWYALNREALRNILCANESVRSAFADDRTKIRDIVLLLCDVVAGHCVGVSPIYVSYLVVKLGLDSLCEGY